MDEKIFHLRSYGDVTRQQLEQYFETVKISRVTGQETKSFADVVADSPNP